MKAEAEKEAAILKADGEAQAIRTVQQALTARGYTSPSESHILPVIIGDSHEAILKAEDMRRKGFYVLPVRPPTVPEGTSRLRLSLTASLTEADVERLIQAL